MLASQCQDCSRGGTSELKTTLEWDTCTLDDIDDERQKLARKLLLQSFTLVLANASKGCVSITYYIPPTTVAQLQADIKKTAVKEMADMEIESITVDSVVCYEAPLLQT